MESVLEKLFLCTYPVMERFPPIKVIPKFRFTIELRDRVNIHSNIVDNHFMFEKFLV